MHYTVYILKKKTMKSIKKTTKLFLLSILLIALLSVVIFMDNWSMITNILRIVFGSVVLLFIPGRRVTKIAFKHKEIDLLERIALSFAFSISIVPLIVFYTNLAWVKITERLVIGIVLAIVCCCFVFSFIKKAENTDKSSKKIDE